ncbi:hypothetical protein RND71_002465 [Anisodus tanguticus]|uniref:Uncharacterized protein n=1 Tax=Anisodus tanguticus TaxID=243964 RepID=A0AAE1VRZ5_9SOLA|nr:hypothetical protein RND71_002465 [Anisodus tanguticus]
MGTIGFGDCQNFRLYAFQDRTNALISLVENIRRVLDNIMWHKEDGRWRETYSPRTDNQSQWERKEGSSFATSTYIRTCVKNSKIKTIR